MKFPDIKPTIFAVLLLPLSAMASDPHSQPMRFSTFSPCNGNGSFCGIRILAEGVIQQDTGEKFKEFLKDRQHHQHELPPRPTVVFDSPGGSVTGGMELGRAIRANQLDTELEPSYSTEHETLVENALCASACVIAFSGGMTRTVQPGSALGIHQFSGGNRDLGESQAQVTVVVLSSYFREMGIGSAMLDTASLTPASSMYWVTDVEAKRYRIDNNSENLSAWQVSPTLEGDAILKVIQDVSYGRSVSLELSVSNGKGHLATTIRLQKSAIRPDRVAQFPVNEYSEIQICTQSSCVDTQPAVPWTRRDFSELTSFRADSELTLDELKSLSRAQVLTISDGFPRATSDVSLSTELSVEGFAAGVALLMRQR